MEGALTSVQPTIHEFVKTKFARCDEAVKNIERRDNDKTELDIFFRKIIEMYFLQNTLFKTFFF